ncbi:hypothetical protein EDB92DRAFT_1950964 [Lactarius akahatsu]|uniref:Uncharacterized protein n=1 Tax=Lactarius akahatsu TaxID=416441 RepID=A0AAD4L8B2_9AGAM|nr:hypothetical protein EDB92DRAFT_1950964 [Lactarius akahatsu]
MIPLVPTVALALVSLLCSAFVILRTVLSTLSPRTLSRRLLPLHYSPPSSRALPPADKSYIWLALCDISALSVFVWEVFAQWSSSSSSANRDSGAISGIGTTSRLWLALTLRQTCFLIVSALILIHVRLRKSVSFGVAHWLLWQASSPLRQRLPGHIFRVGYIAYSSAVAVLNTVMFGCFVGTLIFIKRSLESFHKAQSSNDSAQAALATEEVDAIRDGSTWITSTTSSRPDATTTTSISHSTTRTRLTSQSAATSPEPLRFPFWAPPVPYAYSSLPQTPFPRRDDAPCRDFEPFRRRAQSLRAAALSLSSRNSWITSSFGTHPTLSAWSFPTLSSHQPSRVDEVESFAIASTPSQDRSPVSVRPPPAAVPGVRALDDQTEKTQPSSPPSSAPPPPVIDISVMRILAWLAGVWVPLLFALPYILHLNGSNLQSSKSASVLLTISVTVSSPILALNLLLRHPIPIWSGVFDAPRDPHPVARKYSPSMGSPSPFSDRHTWSPRARQVTAGTGATDGKSHLKRLLGVLSPAPKLSLLPPSNDMKTPQASARNGWPSVEADSVDAVVHASAEDGPRTLVPPRRRAQTLPQHRHPFHLPQRYAQSYRHDYDRPRERENGSLTVSLPGDLRHDPLLGPSNL